MLNRFSLVFFIREIIFMASCLLFLQIKPLLKNESTLKEKNLLPRGANSFLSEQIFFQEWGEKNCFYRVASCRSVSISLKWTIYCMSEHKCLRYNSNFSLNSSLGILESLGLSQGPSFSNHEGKPCICIFLVFYVIFLIYN